MCGARGEGVCVVPGVRVYVCGARGEGMVFISLVIQLTGFHW